MTIGLHTDIERHQVDPIGKRDEWLALRQNDVTASVAGALFGVHEYCTPYELWALKSGLITDSAEESKPMRRGRLLEPVALQMLREERPTWIIDACRNYFRDPSARIGATPDAIATDPAREGFGVVQIKSVESSIFRRKWRNEEGEPEPPLWIALQALVEAELTGASWAVVAALTIGFGAELHIVDVPFNAQVLAELRKRAADFWHRVEAKEPPPLDYAKDGALLARLYTNDDGSTIDLTGDNRVPELVRHDAMLAEEAKNVEKARKELKAEFLEKIGAAAVAMMNGVVVATAKTVRRKEYTVKATAYRDLRIKRTGEAA